MRLPSRALLALASATALPAQQFLDSQPPGLGLTTIGAASLQLVAAGDYDGDGDVDLALAGPFTLRLLRNDGTGRFSDASAALPSASPPGFPTTLLLFDADADGRAELLVGGYFGTLMYSFTAAGAWLDRTSTLPVVTHPLRFAAADFDLDGDVDLIGAASFLGGGSDALWTNTGAAFVAGQPFVGQSEWVNVGDIDGDGDADLLLGSPARLMRNDGNMSFVDVTAAQLPGVTSAGYAQFGDVDGDGDQDLVTGSPITAQATLLQNQGGGTFAAVAAAIAPLSGPTRGLQLRDLDGDGDLDLLRSSASGEVALELNDGNGSFTTAPNAVPTIGSDSVGVLAEDFDGDGDGDLVASPATSAGHLLWNLHRQVVPTGAPTLGLPWPIVSWSAPAVMTARPLWLGFALDRLPQPFALPELGDLWLDLNGPYFAEPLSIAPGASSTSYSLLIPNSAGLQGLVLHVQALIDGGNGPFDLRLTTVAEGVVQ